MNVVYNTVMKSRNQREGNYTGHFNGEADRQRGKRNKRLLGWAYVMRGVEDEINIEVAKLLEKRSDHGNVPAVQQETP